MTRPIAVIGHRGARGLFPENTLEGFRKAHALGVRWFELDVGMTADDVPVVTHDLRLNPVLTRGPDGGWLSRPTPLIRDLTHDALRRYDVGRARPRSVQRLRFPWREDADDVRIPRLEDVLRLPGDTRFLLELKTDPREPEATATPERMTGAVLALLDATGTMGRVILESFDWRVQRHARRLCPSLPLAWLTSPETERDAGLWWAMTPLASTPASVAAQMGGASQMDGEAYWAPSWRNLTEAGVAEAHARGLRVLPWTVNKGAAMRRLLRWGVDGLITDRPDIALAQRRAYEEGPGP